MAGIKGIPNLGSIGKVAGLKKLGGIGKVGPNTGSALPMAKKFLLYRNTFGNLPSIRKKLGPMGPNMGKPGSIAGGAPKNIGGPEGTGNVQALSGFHRMGLL